MRAQKITFILCIELSLKTSLNSILSGEHRANSPWQGVTSLSLFCDKSDMLKPQFDPSSTGQSIRRASSYSSFPSGGCMCSPFVYGGGRQSWNAAAKEMDGKDKKENFHVVNSMCPILSCRCDAGWVKIQSFMPIYKLGVVGWWAVKESRVLAQRERKRKIIALL